MRDFISERHNSDSEREMRKINSEKTQRETLYKRKRERDCESERVQELQRKR